MFNNLINIHDISKLAEKIKQGELNRILSKLGSRKQGKIKKSWEHIENPPMNWWDIPTVTERWNYLISGDAKVDYYEYFSHKFLSDKESLNALSLGCGIGELELRWAELGKFKSIDAYDLSDPRIEYAKSKAKEKGYGEIINYRVADVYHIEILESYYDVVLVEHSLHHFSPLEEILLRVNSFLKPDGYFIVNEFVGPTRFEWTDRQLEIINGLLSILPAKYRAQWNSNTVKSKVFRPGRLRMILDDPSEAVESSRILPLLHQIFDVIEIKEYGGTILHLLFSGIAHNFLKDNSETRCFMNLCFEVEDQLLKSGDIQSDFVVTICRKRSAVRNSSSQRRV